MSLNEQIEKAAKRVRELKRVSPEIFLEWNRLKLAERLFDEARDELDAARDAWDRLGNRGDK
jgi:hypothetical protein